MVRGLVVAGQAQHLRAKLSQVPLHLLLLRALDVVLGWVLQVCLDLSVGGEEEEGYEMTRQDGYWDASVVTSATWEMLLV